MMSTIDDRDMDRNSGFHERIDILKNKGYRGFTVEKNKNRWSGVEIIAKNPHGQLLKTNGETEEEAYIKMIDLIDQSLDEQA